MGIEIVPVDYQADNSAELFVASLRATGFGVLTHHPIEPSLVDSIYHHWLEFFNTQEKYNYTYNKGTQDGYFPLEVSEVAKGFSAKDIKEYYHYYPWGQCPNVLREELETYYRLAHELAAELLGWVEDYTPQEIAADYSQPLSTMIENSEQTLLRILHYPPLSGDEEPSAIRAAAHEDINLLTILPAASNPGLQVQTAEGWLDVPCDFNNLIINIGDMLQEASAGYFPSTTHQVINPEGASPNESRMSLPLFLHPRPDVVLSSRYTAESYLNERLQELQVV